MRKKKKKKDRIHVFISKFELVHWTGQDQSPQGTLICNVKTLQQYSENTRYNNILFISPKVGKFPLLQQQSPQGSDKWQVATTTVNLGRL